MILIHRTDKKNLKSIEELGLKRSFNPSIDVARAAIFLNSYKPDDLPKFMDREKALYFSPDNTTFRLLCYRDPLELVIDSDSLDLDRLYYHDGNIVKKIHNLTHRAIKRKNKKELEKILNSTQFKNTCEFYWNSLINFRYYERNYPPEDLIDKNIEIIYFGDIAPEKLNIRFIGRT